MKSFSSIIRELQTKKHSNIYVYPKAGNNPYTQILYNQIKHVYYVKTNDILRLLFSKTTCIIHVNWIGYSRRRDILKQVLLITLLFIHKYIAGNVVILTPHNKYPHGNNSFLNRLFYKIYFIIPKYIFVHGFYEYEYFKEEYGIKTTPIRHPNYPIPTFYSESFYQESPKLIKATTQDYFLIFGNYSTYKGVEYIIELWPKKYETRYALIICGENTCKLKKLILGKNIIIIDTKLNDTSLYFLIKNASFCIFNFLDITTSGSLILAKSYKTKVIAPRKGNIPEYVQIGDILFETNEELNHIIETLVKYHNDKT